MQEDDASFKKALQRAFRLLSQRSRSREELRAKLHEKGFPGEVIDRVFVRLAELNYLDDESFAMDRARHLASARLNGNRKIEADLRQKGVPADIIHRAIVSAREEFSESQGLKRLIEKKLKMKNISRLDRKEKRSIFQSLAGKGYSLPSILEAFGESEEEFIHDGE
jgi:regulatory protein